jgi:predicted permease
MSLLSRIANVFRGERLAREIDEELQSHIDEAVENGRDPDEVRRAFGARLATRDASRDVRLVPWLDSLRADISFGWRQLLKSKVTSAAAILSLGLAAGAGVSAFRLADAVLLRPLPIDRPERLYSVVSQVPSPTTGQPVTISTVDHPLFRAMREDLSPEAQLIAVSNSQSTDLSYESDIKSEKAYVQYVSGWMFANFGLRPALGRLLTEDDDKIPQGHPYAVLSFDYWQTRFAADPEVIGETFSLDKRLYEIVGVVQRGFSGTETGTMTDIFVPITMNPLVNRSERVWFMTLALIESDIEVQPQLARMQVLFSAQLQDRDYRSRGLSDSQVEERLSQQLRLEPASAGVSGMQRSYRQALVTLSFLVALVMLIACANVSNLMTARSSARAREMALRIAIGAGRRRLAQLALVECAQITAGAALIAGLFAWWATPLIVSSLPTGPVRLALPFDWRLFQFSLGLTLAVTILCGLRPALHASAVRPLAALKGGDDPRTLRPAMSRLIGAQVALCAVVLFFSGLFVATLDRLAKKPLGYSPERLLAVDAVAAQPHPAVTWNQVADRLRAVPGVDAVSLAERPLRLDTVRLTNVSVNSAASPEEMAFALNLSITPGWIDTMNVPLIRGRDLLTDDARHRAALVNEQFANTYFDGENPIGKSFNQGRSSPVEVVGLVGDFQDFRLREPVMPAFYTLLGSVNADGEPSQFTRASFIVRTSDEDSLALAETIRREIPEAHSDFSVGNITTQQELNASQLARERLIAILASFFASVALILSAVGIYGVLHYSVVQRRREIGVRIALGAQAGNIALRVTKAMFAPVLLGSGLGLAIGVGLERYIADLLWNVQATDPAMMAVPALAILAALLAAVPEVIRAVRVDPTELLRTD